MALVIINKGMPSEIRFPADNVSERILYNSMDAVKSYDLTSGEDIPPIPKILTDNVFTVDVYTDDGYKIPLTNTYNKIIALSSRIDDLAHMVIYTLDLAKQ